MLARLWCALAGHDWLPFPRDIWQPIRCHRCGYQTFNYWKGK